MISKISIVTPCFNAERFIKETVESVINQTAVISGRVELEYIICDGYSSDKTVDIIKDINSPLIKLISEPDAGMYSALSKGLQSTSGDIIAYINAGDYYHKCAFDIVLDLFEDKDKQVAWLTGYTILYNEQSYALPQMLPYRYRSRLFNCGMYLSKLPFVQQESTFWSSSLMNSCIDFECLARFKSAGDFYIWKQFSNLEELKIVEAYLGGFRRQRGQLSENRAAYDREVSDLVVSPNLMDSIIASLDSAIFYFAPNKLKKILNDRCVFRFNHSLQKWI
ncbi:glycosyltransferase [Chamaesiphon sp.]|uniref:glycosyltransferase n=1 Tax=Chamaesiphon sp. TaxID=2814140 RepID=UPI00359347BF